MILCVDLLHDNIIYYFFIIFEPLWWNCSVTRVCNSSCVVIRVYFVFVWFGSLYLSNKKKYIYMYNNTKTITYSCYRIVTHTPHIYIYIYLFLVWFFVLCFFRMMTWHTVTVVRFHYTSLYKVRISQIH
jgi:hypothetical protein